MRRQAAGLALGHWPCAGWKTRAPLGQFPGFRDTTAVYLSRKWRMATHPGVFVSHKFIETIRVELLGLHEGNIARYRLRPGEFAQWKSKQKS